MKIVSQSNDPEAVLDDALQMITKRAVPEFAGVAIIAINHAEGGVGVTVTVRTKGGKISSEQLSKIVAASLCP